MAEKPLYLQPLEAKAEQFVLQTIVDYFQGELKALITTDEARRMMPFVRKKMSQLSHNNIKNRMHIREAISHVLTIRGFKGISRIPTAEEVTVLENEEQ